MKEIKKFIKSGRLLIIEVSDPSYAEYAVGLVKESAGPNDYLEPFADRVKIRDFILRRNKTFRNGGFVVIAARSGDDISPYVLGLSDNQVSTFFLDINLSVKRPGLEPKND